MALSVVRAEISPDELLARLRAGDNRVFDALYRNHRIAFITWATPRYSHLSIDDFDDAFQDAAILFYEQVRNGRIRTLTANPSTIIFRLASRICAFSKKSLAGPIKVYPLFSINSSDNDVAIDSMFPDSLIFTDSQDVIDAELARDEQVARAIQQLSADCARLLTAFYYEGQTLAKLSTEFGHRDTSTTTVRKSQCLARLRTLCGVTRA